MSKLSDRIKTLSIEKIDFLNDEAEVHVRDLNLASMDLDEAVDALDLSAAGDPDIEEVADSLVDLADLADDVNLSGAQQDSLNNIVNKLVKTGNEDQKEKLKTVFAKTLQYFITVKAHNAYFNQLLATPTE